MNKQLLFGYRHLKAYLLNAFLFLSLIGAANNCSNPTVIASLPFTGSATTCGSGNDYGIQCGGLYGGGEDYVYELNITTTGPQQISVTNTSGGNYIGWFLKSGTNCATASSCLANATSSSNSTALGTYNFTATGTYYLIIDTWPTPNCAAFNISINTPPPPPANDNCSGAVLLTQNSTCTTTSGTVANATQSQSGCVGTADDDVWYRFVATSPSPIIDVQGSASFDAVVQLFSGSCGSLTSITCRDNTGSGGLEKIVASNLTVGNTYYLRVYHYFSSVPTTPTFTICIYAPPIDAAITGLASPIGCLGASETVTYNITNAGSAALNFVTNPLTVNGAVTGPNPATFTPVTINTGTLAVGATLPVTLATNYDMTALGTYVFTGNITLTGDMNTSNNTMASVSRTQTAVYPLPVGCDFNGFTGSNLPSVCGGFSEATGATVPTGTSSSWTSSSSSQTPYFGSTTAKVNIWLSSHNEWILLPKLIPVTAPNSTMNLTFEAAVTNYAATSTGTMEADDKVWVKISTDCGATWNTIFTLDNTSGLNNQLQDFTVDLSPYAGQQVIIGFHATGGATSGTVDIDFHLDNVMVRQVFDNDVAASALTAPEDDECGTVSQDIIVTITNPGNLPQSNIPVTAIISGTANTTLTGTLAGPLNPDASATINLGSVNTVAGGALNVTAFTSLTTDQNMNNDTLITTVNIVALPPIPVGIADSGCIGDSIDLMVDAPDPNRLYSWYDAASGGTLLGQGTTFNTSVLNTTTTYYLEAAEITTANLQTTFAGGNGCTHGNMFNIQALAGPVTITGFDLNVNNTTANTPVVVYYIPGGYQGNETNQAAWTLVGNHTVNGAGSGNAVFLNSADFTIPAGATYGIYVDYDATYTNGTNTYNDGIIQINTGAGLCTAFSGPINSRTFNGRVYYLAAGCASLRTPVTAHISQIAVNAGADMTICDRDIVALGTANTATGGLGAYTYSWTPTTGLDNPMAANPNANPSSTTTYVVTVMDDAGCMAMDTVKITVKPLPNASFTAPALVCSNDQPFMLMPALAGGTFTGTGVTAGGIFDAGTAGAGTHRIYYSITGANGCFNMDSLDIVVNQSPDASITVMNTNLCFNSGVTTLTALNPGGVWSGNGITNPATGAFDPAVAGLGPHAIYYTITTAAGCVDMDMVTITVNALTPVSIAPVGPLCTSGNPVQLVASVAGGTWSGTGVSATGMFNPATAGVGVHTISYAYVNANNCTTTATRNITVNPSPTFTINAVTPVCVSSAPIALTASISGGSWSGPGVMNQFTGLFNPANAGIGTHTISYTVTNGFGCSTTQTTTVTVNAGPNATINAAGPFCGNGAAVQLTAATSGGTWSGTGVSASGMFNPVTAGPGMHVITYSVTASGCTATATRTFMVTAPVVVTANMKHESCANNDDASIDMNVTGGHAPYVYAWSNGATSQDLFNLGAGTYTVTVTDVNNCASTQSFTVNTSTTITAVVDSILPTTTPSNQHGAIYITVSGGTPPYEYVWSNGATTQDLMNARTDTFTVTIYDANGCSAVYSFFVPTLFGVGFDALSLDKGFNMYPNPTSGLLNVDLLLGRNADVRLEVYDVVGRKLYAHEASVSNKYQHQLDAGNLASGTYILKLTVDNETITRPFVITK